MSSFKTVLSRFYLVLSNKEGFLDLCSFQANFYDNSYYLRLFSMKIILTRINKMNLSVYAYFSYC
jgi:hypothetical protein